MDLDKLKDPLPDTLSWQGITFYGTIDVGYGYQTHGAPLWVHLSAGRRLQHLLRKVWQQGDLLA